MRHSNPLLVLAFVLGFLPAKAQEEVVPFQFQDPQALEITPEVLELLSRKSWNLYERRFYLASETYSSSGQGYGIFFRFIKGGAIQGAQKEPGSWKVLEGKLLYLDIPGERGFSGPYSIRHLSEKELILSKSLTSSHENRIELRYATEPKPREVVPIKPKGTAIELDKPVSVVPFDKLSLLDQLKVEYFIRGLKLPEGINQATEGELRDLYNQLLKKR
ncbi:MAG: hypothetical protein KIPDCIKN_03288 [Haliscomenobacter sp.]|nr:hypothetical protein [Haliscomenobacter sp.]